MANSVTTTEQLCYIPCNFCKIVLAIVQPIKLKRFPEAIKERMTIYPKVSVPCSSLFDIVTVRCGHCTNLWSVNMAAALQSLSRPNFQAINYAIPEDGSSSRGHTKIPSRISTRSTTDQRVVNRPPEKRQRVPSAYNQFIKEEIQRIKANNPDISHREAFSTAAKNWAHFPHIHFSLMLESNKQTKLA